MISSMAFGVSQVRDFLKKTGHVLTVRGYDYQTPAAVVPDLGNILITRAKVCEIKSINDLVGFLPLSGFKTVSAWWAQIRKFCKGSMFLYRVQINDQQISKMEEDNERREQTRKDNLFHAADREFIAEHPYDIRSDPGMNDPALVDLAPFKEAAHADRLQREARAAERRTEAMRARQQQNAARMRYVPDPALIEKKATQQALIAIVTAQAIVRDETIHAYIEEVSYDILQETDLNIKMVMLENLKDAKGMLGNGA